MIRQEIGHHHHASRRIFGHFGLTGQQPLAQLVGRRPGQQQIARGHSTGWLQRHRRHQIGQNRCRIFQRQRRVAAFDLRQTGRKFGVARRREILQLRLGPDTRHSPLAEGIKIQRSRLGPPVNIPRHLAVRRDCFGVQQRGQPQHCHTDQRHRHESVGPPDAAHPPRALHHRTDIQRPIRQPDQPRRGGKQPVRGPAILRHPQPD